MASSGSTGYGISNILFDIDQDTSYKLTSIKSESGITLYSNNLGETKITGSTTKFKNRTSSFPVAFLIGTSFPEKSFRLGIEIAARYHKIDTSTNGKGQLHIDPKLTSQLPGNAIITTDPTNIGTTSEKIDDNMRLVSILPKFFLDFKITRKVFWYVGGAAGIGYARIQAEVESKANTFDIDINVIPQELKGSSQSTKSSIEVKDTIFTGQLILGIESKLGSGISGFLEVQFTQTSKIKSPVNKTYSSAVGMIGFTFFIT